MTSPVSGSGPAETGNWRRWVRRNQDSLYFSVVTMMEVRFGIEKCLAKGATEKARKLNSWLLAAETLHRGRMIPVTLEIAHRAGILLHRAIVPDGCRVRKMR